MSRSPNLEHRVTTAAEVILARQKFVTAVDVCLGIGWLNSSNIDLWRQGQVDSLARLNPVQTDYVASAPPIDRVLAGWA